MKTSLLATLFATLFAASLCATAQTAGVRKFDFTAQPAAGYTAVPAASEYSASRGYGFEPVAAAGSPAFFSVDLPEGNYNVTVTLGGAQEAVTTVKSELRRLMLENVRTAPGKTEARTFTVNVRTPQIPAGAGLAAGAVKLKAPRETVQEAWNWDRRLTLEFNGARPAVRSVTIAPAQTPTIFLLGDSTVCDQPGEPYASWGQMLPRFLKPGIAVANHGESGETYRDSLARRRLDKVLSALRPGDTVMMQFGHNDQKQIKEGKGGPFTTYKDEIRQHVESVRAHGGVPVIISSMERRAFDANGKVVPSLIDYATAARQSAQELGVAFIDLNAMSKPFYEALGPEASKAAFAEPQPGRIDNTHHNNYGAYELAQAVLTGMRQAGLPAAAYIADGYGSFDPARPDPVAKFAVPASPTFTNERPLGDEANAATGSGAGALPGAAANAGTTIPSDQNYLARLSYQAFFADYLALRKGRQSDLIFIGDSITEQFRWGAGAPVWTKRFESRAFDFGQGGDKTQHVLWRLENFDLSFVKPKVAVILIGTNNVTNAPEDIAAGVKAVVAATQKKFAGVKVVLISILPNARADQRMAAVNKLIAPLADDKSIWYLNLAARFTPEGDNWKGLSADKLHLTTAGYTVWADELETLLAAVQK